MIRATELYKSFGARQVLSGASFEVESGTMTALVGPNGSGKTTTLHILAGLATPDAGAASVDGVDIRADRAAAQKRVAFLPQDVRFHSALTPRQVLRFYAGLRGVPAERIDDVLEGVDLVHAADKPCGTMSGGMRQRLGIALLELANASVILLDEPALSLDPSWRQVLTDRLQGRVQEGATVLLATHLLEVWEPVVDDVLTCAEGQVRREEPQVSSNSVPAEKAVS